MSNQRSMRKQMEKSIPKLITVTNVSFVYVNSHGLLIPNEALSQQLMDAQSQLVIMLTQGPIQQITPRGIRYDRNMAGYNPIEFCMTVASALPGQFLKVGDAINLLNMFVLHPKLKEMFACKVTKIIKGKGATNVVKPGTEIIQSSD